MCPSMLLAVKPGNGSPEFMLLMSSEMSQDALTWRIWSQMLTMYRESVKRLEQIYVGEESTLVDPE